MPPKTANPKQRRQQLLLAGAAIVVVLFALLRRSSAQAAAASAAQQPVAQPAFTPASDGLGSSGVDNAGQLASFESSLLNSLPQTIASSIQAGFQNGLGPAGNAPAPGTTSTVGDVAGLLGALGGFEQAQASIFAGGGAGGQQVPAKSGPPSFYLRPGVTLDRGQKLQAGAKAHLGKRAGHLGPTGGWHPG